MNRLGEHREATSAPRFRYLNPPDTPEWRRALGQEPTEVGLCEACAAEQATDEPDEPDAAQRVADLLPGPASVTRYASWNAPTSVHTYRRGQ
jgi:hypothetical protein